jgi:hypothetical protein
MRRFVIKNEENDHVTVDLIRYFRFKNDEFLIYSKSEVDEKNYMKLYLVRVMEELGEPVIQTIKNESDWSNMQVIVKKVLKEIKAKKIKNFEDLDYEKIQGIKIVNPRYFKLDVKLVDILSSGYFENRVEKEDSNELESIDETLAKEANFSANESNNEKENTQEEVDYKSLYLAVKKENESSAELIDQLMEKVMQYQEKFGELEN